MRRTGGGGCPHKAREEGPLAPPGASSWPRRGMLMGPATPETASGCFLARNVECWCLRDSGLGGPGFNSRGGQGLLDHSLPPPPQLPVPSLGITVLRHRVVRLTQRLPSPFPGEGLRDGDGMEVLRPLPQGRATPQQLRLTLRSHGVPQCGSCPPPRSPGDAPASWSLWGKGHCTGLGGGCSGACAP